MKPLIIIGGGPAGAAAAIHLARAGHPVRLFERQAGPHDKVCGEFISYEAVDALARVGIDLRALGAAPITRLTVTAGRRRVSSSLPFAALSLSRRVLDEALLDAAQRAGAEVRRGQRVTRLEPGPAGWQVEASDGDRDTAAQVFLASGKHDLRGHARPRGRQADLIGFKLHLDPAVGPFPGNRQEVSVHLFRGGYAGLEPVDADRLNLCLVVRQSTYAAWGRNWPSLIRRLAEQCPHLGPVLNDGAAERCTPLAISGIPYGHVQKTAEPGLWRLGDQAAVIPSFAGEGMAIALHSAELAVGRFRAGDDSAGFQAALARQVQLRVAGASLLSRAMITPLGHAVSRLALALAPATPGLLGRATRLPRRAIARAARECAGPTLPYAMNPSAIDASATGA